MNSIRTTDRPRKRFLCRWVIVVCFILLALPARTAEPAYSRTNDGIPGEFELKAIYLYNFLQFVQWPADKCRQHGTRIHEIAVLGDSPLNDILKILKKTLREKNKDLELTFLGPYRPGMDLSSCCLLFINEGELAHLPKILAGLAGKAVLTVTDGVTDRNHDVMITLVSQQNKIRWTVNRRPVQESGLQLSAKVLDIAVRVIE